MANRKEKIQDRKLPEGWINEIWEIHYHVDPILSGTAFIDGITSLSAVRAAEPQEMAKLECGSVGAGTGWNAQA